VSSTTSRPGYRRVPFELAGDAPLRHFADPAGISFVAADDEVVVGLLARALLASLAPRDAAEVRRRGARPAAGGMIDDALSGGVYECQRSWWSVVAVRAEPAGVVLPVVFSDGARDGRDEGTLYHLAVVAGQRGFGLGHLLLGRATDTLLAHGVWQISCDTAIENTPMLRLFEKQNWLRRPAVEVAPR